MKTIVHNLGPSENEIQAAFFDWLSRHESKHPELSLCFAIPNGSHKSPAARGLFKRTGLKPGVPDCFLPVAGYGGDGVPMSQMVCKGLWIEFKSKRGTVSETQRWWGEALKAYGHRVEVCRSWTDAANIVIEYLNLPMENLCNPTTSTTK